MSSGAAHAGRSGKAESLRPSDARCASTDKAFRAAAQLVPAETRPGGAAQPLGPFGEPWVVLVRVREILPRRGVSPTPRVQFGEDREQGADAGGQRP